MSVIYPDERREWWAPATSVCFVCGGSVPPDMPAVMWAGEDRMLFHTQCARKLGANLIGDARAAMLAGGGSWAGAARKLVAAVSAAREGPA
jgi:hypothetical protein